MSTTSRQKIKNIPQPFPPCARRPSRLPPLTPAPAADERRWSGGRDSNPRQPAWKAGVLPLNYPRNSTAESGVRIADSGLRVAGIHPIRTPHSARHDRIGGQGGIRTPEGVSQQIYSLPPLAAWVPAPTKARGLRRSTPIRPCRSPRTSRLHWSWRSDLHRQPPVYKTGALLLSYASPSRRAAESAARF